MSNTINLAIPAIGMEFGANQSALNWVVSAFYFRQPLCYCPLAASLLG
jgi:hypothetical protein